MVILAVGAVCLPCLYLGLLRWYQPGFELEQNRNRKLLRTVPELLAVLFSELAWVKFCHEYGTGMMLGLLYITLVWMTVLCITDYWEKLVPNRLLLLYLLMGVIVLGIQGLRDIGMVLLIVPSMVLGFLFCVISFGAAYLLSHGSMGSGDVKLAVLLGIFLTGEYVIGTVFYGCMISAVYSVVQLWRKKLTRKDELPFVPFLYMGLIFTCFVG